MIYITTAYICTLKNNPLLSSQKTKKTSDIYKIYIRKRKKKKPIFVFKKLQNEKYKERPQNLEYVNQKID